MLDAALETEPVVPAVHPDSGNRARRWLRVALLAAPVVLVVVMAWQRRWVSDDAFINFRIVNELRAGHGLVFNPGERVEAGTSFLWVLILAAAKLVTPFRLEWISVVLGIAATGAGLLLAQLGAAQLLDDDERNGLLLPFGALIIAAVPAFWDFATSGLDTGLGFGWLGWSFYLLARGVRRPDRSPILAAVVIGLGPLVRPDFAIYSIAFYIALLVVRRADSWRARIVMTAAALALPVAVQIFRMAYYASLLPNTALAKEAGRSYWSQGWQYLHNFAAPYFLYLPFIFVICVASVVLSDRWMRGPAWRAVMIAPVAAAIVHALYVVRLGGDFMHARFLLPAFFVLMLPLAVLPLRGPVSIGVVAVALLWAVPVAGWMRAKQVDAFIADERHVWMMVSGHENPVNIKDFHNTFAAYTGSLARDLQDNARRNPGRRYLVTHSSGFPTGPNAYPGFRLLPLDPSIPHSIVIEGGPLGASAYSTPDDVFVVDELGLGDVIAARLKMPQHGRPGHEKVLPESWVLGRFASPGTSAPFVSDADIAAARTALACPPLQEVMRRTSGALSFGDLVGNFFASPRLTSLRVPQDPTAAAFKVCKR